MRALAALPRLVLFVLIAFALSCGDDARVVADPGADRDGLAGEPMDFDGSASTGPITSWSWSFGDGESASGKTVKHTFAQPGDFEVSLTVAAESGTKNSKTVAVHIGCAAKAVLQVTSQDIQPGMPVELDGSGSSGCPGAALTEFHWDFGDGQTADGGPEKAKVSHTWAAKGTYSLVLRVVDAKGFEGRSSRTLNLGITAGKPIVSCPATATAEAGKAKSFSASASDPGGASIASYDWTFSDDGAKAQGTTVSHTFMSTGTFSASVVAKTSDGRASDACTTAVTVTAPVNFTGKWLLNPASSSMTGCSRFSVGFPAAFLDLVHNGTNLDATPSGNGWPSGQKLTGTEQGAPDPAFTYKVRGTLPSESHAGCGNAAPIHSVKLTFNGTNVTGTWIISYDFGCTNAGCADCGCNAQGTFTGKKQ